MHTENELKRFATRIRIELVKCLGHRGFGHAGGSLSLADLLAVLYMDVLNVRPDQPKWEGRDYVVCSKGHAGPALYSVLALKGFFPTEVLYTLNEPHTTLPSHCDQLLTPGIDVTAGSLGQGVSVGMGIAHGLKLKGSIKQRVYIVLGDGECQEGQVWEAAGFARQKRLGNVIAFLDANGRQCDGYTKDILDMEDYSQKFAAFGWHVQRVDGTDVMQIRAAVLSAQQYQGDRPAVIIMDGVKGSGAPEIMALESNHNISFSPGLAERSIAYLEQQLLAMGG